MKKKGYVIITHSGRIVGGANKNSVFPSKRLAEQRRKAIIKNNTLKQRQRTGYLNLAIRKTDLHTTGDPTRSYWLRPVRRKYPKKTNTGGLKPPWEW